MSTITESVTVDVPVRAVYDQWTQFESFPEFMDGVDSIEQLDDSTLHWVTSIGPVRREFDATIVEQRPDRLVSWRSLDGPEHAGVVSFEAAAPDRTVVTAEMSIDPEGLAEKVGDRTGILQARVRGDLERFKAFIEERGRETGGWRGEISDHPGTSAGPTDEGTHA